MKVSVYMFDPRERSSSGKKNTSKCNQSVNTLIVRKQFLIFASNWQHPALIFLHSLWLICFKMHYQFTKWLLLLESTHCKLYVNLLLLHIFSWSMLLSTLLMNFKNFLGFLQKKHKIFSTEQMGNFLEWLQQWQGEIDFGFLQRLLSQLQQCQGPHRQSSHPLRSREQFLQLTHPVLRVATV